MWSMKSVMEPKQKRVKIDRETTENGLLIEEFPNSTAPSSDGRNSEENYIPQKVEKEREVIEAGNKQLPACEYGLECNRTDLIHFAEFLHPTKVDKEKISQDEGGCYEEDECEVVEISCHEMEATQQLYEEYSDDSGDEIDENSNVMHSNQEKQVSPDSSESRILRDDTVLSRGPSIVKCYSMLSEIERRELIRRAFEMKDLLKKELHKTLGIIEEKNKELRRVHSQLERGQLMVDGEKEALDKGELHYFPLFAEREYKEGSAAQMHFRLAESQFYRLVNTTDKYRVTNVEYVVNPVLIRRFQKAKEKLTKARGEQMSYPVLAFHGTKEENIHSICNTGFRVPGEANFEHATDTGFYGRGVYFSEYPSYSMNFIRGASRLLLCQVLPGKVHRCTKLIHGEPLEMGHDSHTSPDGKELVIFNSHHILPSYVVHYGEADGDFKYQTTHI